MLILNIAAGKFDPLPIENDYPMLPQYILNVDTSYFSKETPDQIETGIDCWLCDKDRTSNTTYLNIDVFEFMEKTRHVFDRVVIYRFLEHISFTQVEYFIYLVSTVLRKGGLVDVIVPDYDILADMILFEPPYKESTSIDFDFQAHNIKLTTELLNEPSCPHASIWTTHRMKRFWHLEGRFKVNDQLVSFKFDDRNIYLRSIIERI